MRRGFLLEVYMQEATAVLTAPVAKRDWLYLVHRIAGLIAVPFLFVSIVLAVSLTHTKLLNALSEKIYPSLPIPLVKLDEPVKPGSWEQALKVGKLAVGADAHVITTRDENTIVLQSFAEHTHDPEVARTNPQTQLLIDTRTMEIVRVQNKNTSLVSMGHGIHAYRFLGINAFSLSTVSSIALLVLLVSGGMLAWRDRKAGKQYERFSFWHVRLGQAIGIFVIVIAVTTLDFEFSFFGQPDKNASHPIPAVQLNEPVRLGSVDQARHLAELATGAAPRAVFIRDGGNDLKFSEEGDGIGGKSVWMNANTMTINRITNWRNDKQALSFILHDGRWMGGMNALNIYDVVAMIMMFLVINGIVVFLRKRKLSSAGRSGVETGASGTA